MNYTNWHRKLRRIAGNPGPCINCGATRTQWALKAEFHRVNERVHVEDVAAYDPLCRKCHARQDGVSFSQQAREARRVRGISPTPETRAKIGDANRGKIHGPMPEIQRAKISAALLGKPKTRRVT